MPPIDPRRITPQSGLPSGTIPTGTRVPDPFAATRVGYEGQRVGLEGERVGLSKRGEAREDQLQPLKVRELTAKVKKAEAEAIKAAQEAQFREPVDELLNVIDASANAHRLTRKGGLAGSAIGRTVGKFIPGTGATDLAGYNDTITANTAFKTLQQMRQESPTGGAVGNVSDTDMKLLGSTIASLNMAQGTPKYQESLQNVLRAYQKVLFKLPGGREAYREWRIKWLGYDPNKKKTAAPASEDVENILQKYGVK